MLLAGSAHVLVGCSGGPDSQALLHALHALRAEHGCALSAAAVDHGLRAEAAEELALARGLAARLEVPFFALRVEVPAGASRQSQARAARYDALLACARALGATALAVGHTLDDQAETVLARLLRGAGIEGLAAIKPRRADGVVRPLLDCSRKQVASYVAACGIPVAHDPSNRDPRYLRARVRARLLPMLCEENRQLPQQLADLADDAREAAGWLDQRASEALAQAEGCVARLRDEPPLVRRWVLRMLIARQAGVRLERAHLIAMDRVLWRGGEVRVPGDLAVSLDERGVLSVSPVTKRGRGSPRPTDKAGKDD